MAKFWKYIWNFFIGITIYSSFIENKFFHKAVLSLGKGIGCLVVFIGKGILDGVFK